MSAIRPPTLDDRFSTPIEASRRGAHRARPKPVSAGLPVIAGLAVVLLVLGGGYAVLTGGSDVDEGSNLAAASAIDQPTPSGGTPAPSAPASAGASEPPAPAQETTAVADPGASEPATDEPEVNRRIALRVLNSTATKGLAARVQADIQSDGWQVDETGNSINRNLAVTKIYYGRNTTRPTAEALQQDLGYGSVVRDAGVAKAGLVVVLGQDAR